MGLRGAGADQADGEGGGEAVSLVHDSSFKGLVSKKGWRGRRGDHSRTVRNLSALPITLTEDSDIASAAMAGDSSRPKLG